MLPDSCGATFAIINRPHGLMRSLTAPALPSSERRAFWKWMRVFCRPMLWCVIWCAAAVSAAARALRAAASGAASASPGPSPPPGSATPLAVGAVSSSKRVSSATTVVFQPAGRKQVQG